MYRIPEYVKKVMNILIEAGFEAYVVGGAVRDMLLGVVPYDYDLATNAKSEIVIELIKSKGLKVVSKLGENYGVVLAIAENKPVEIATFRGEVYGSDPHKPKEVWYCDTLKEDLARRDFTINAMAMDIDGNIIDYYNGKGDLENKTLRTVGDANTRFCEDALRMYRACRFVSQLGFSPEEDLKNAITSNLDRANGLSIDRVKNELNKMLLGKFPDLGILLFVRSGLCATSCIYNENEKKVSIDVLPELARLDGVEQNQLYHRFDVLGHILFALKRSTPELEVRWAVLLHDIAKGLPEIRGFKEDGSPSDHKHEILGAEMTENILTRLNYSKDFIGTVTWLVLSHMKFGMLRDKKQLNHERWLRKEAREGQFRTNEEMVEGFRLLGEVCVADISATRASEINVKKSHIYSKYIVELAKTMPVHTKELNIDGKEVISILEDKDDMKTVMHLLLERVQNESLLNETNVLIDAVYNWQERKKAEIQSAKKKAKLQERIAKTRLKKKPKNKE